MSKSELLELLLKIPNMEEVEQRKALFYLNGLPEKQKNLINFQGSNLKFFTQLTDLLMSQGKDSLVYFLDQLVEKEWIGKDYQHKIEEIKSSIRIEKKTSKTVSIKSLSRLALLGLGIFLSFHFARNSQKEYAVVSISITFLICVFWNFWINLFDCEKAFSEGKKQKTVRVNSAGDYYVD